MSSSPYYEDIHGRQIRPVTLVKTQEDICRRIVSIVKFFFRGGSGLQEIPFRGFLLEGPPGNGKTEIARQAIRRVSYEIGNVYLRFVDSAKIAKPEWGKAEEILKEQFVTDSRKRVVLLLDDIDCLLIKRGTKIAREWHYSINALIFHQLDMMDPANIIVIATTNRPSLIDYALRSRLYVIKVPRLSIEELMIIAKNMLEQNWPTIGKSFNETLKEKILQSIHEELRSKKNPSVRDVQHLIITSCIEKGVWTL
ncbi:MAG: AAA family ATPase [Candidatus Bathyarchaeia archaeon]